MQTGTPRFTVKAHAGGQVSTVAAAAPSSTLPSYQLMALALMSAFLLWLCYFPVDWGWLAWLALVPLLVLVRTRARARWVYLAAWMNGLAFYYPALQWIRYADDRMLWAWIALALYCSLFVPIALFLTRTIDHKTRWPLIFSLPIVWVSVDFIRAHFLTGFAWYFLGHTQHRFLPIIQVSDITGAYGVTFLVAAVNVLIFEWLTPRSRIGNFFQPAARTSWPLRWQTLTVASFVGASLIYGVVRIGQEDFVQGPRLALVQGSIDQRIRNLAASPDEKRESAVEITRKQYRALTEEAVRQLPDLIVWPETSYPEGWTELADSYNYDDLPSDLRKVIQELNDPKFARASNWREATSAAFNQKILNDAERWGIPLLIGVNLDVDESPDRFKRFNSAILIGPGQQVYPVRRYDKVHRVPFGEYIPFLDTLPFMKTFSPYDYDYSTRQGTDLTQFSLGQFRFGVLICFEDTDPFLARQYLLPANHQSWGDALANLVSLRMYDAVKPVEDANTGVDFFVNISNDGWFIGSSEHDEHLAICRFRAVECRRSIARSVNMGISAVVDGSGRIVALPGSDWPNSKKTASVVTTSIPIDNRSSLYVRWGDWLPALCGIAVLAGLVSSMVRPNCRY